MKAVNDNNIVFEILVFRAITENTTKTRDLNRDFNISHLVI